MLIQLGLFLLVGGMAAGQDYPPELVSFEAFGQNPLFEGRGAGHWDARIRERGWIIREGDAYHMWYTGYNASDAKTTMKLGYATSPDGISWSRYADNPIVTDVWVEDMTIVKVGDTYFMFAEGEGDEANLLTSTDKIHWTLQGRLDVRKVNGDPIDPGPFGTPAVLYEDGTWNLIYERDDLGLWLAQSKDLKVWTNVQDDPVMKLGPQPYDLTMIACNQILKYKGRYYIYYHATGPENGKDSWTMNIASSPDLVHWEKYAGNPIIGENHSSGYLVNDGSKFRMYTMHPSVCLFLPK